MELDLSKYPLQELYKRFEEVEQKEANVSKFEKTVLDEKVKLQNFEGFSLDDLENLIDGNEVISHDQLNLLTKKLESVSRELKDIKTIFQSEVPVYIHFETRRRFRKSGLEASYKKTIKHIIKDSHSKIGHADLINVRKTHSEPNIHFFRVFHDTIDFIPDIPCGFLDF